MFRYPFAALVLIAGLVSAPALSPARADETFVTHKVLTPEVALELAEATLKSCRKAGYQVTVAVVDRFGILQVVLRDRFAGAHTPETARRKAWTAVSFRTDTGTLEELSAAGKPISAVRFVTGALMVGGGVPVEAAGSIVAGIGVSGAPGGEADAVCARDGIESIFDKLGF